MFGLRTRPKDVRIASFVLGLCIFALMPTEIGYQDIGALLARQSGVAERWQKRVSLRRSPTCSSRPISFRPSDRNVVAAAAELSSREPRAWHRHHRFDRPQSACRAAAALSGRRFPQGRPHAEGRPSRDAAAGACRRDGAGRRRSPRIPRRSNFSATGAKSAALPPRPCRQGRGRAGAARSRTAGGAECAAAAAI